MKILVIGGGGREHALVWKLKQSARVEKIWCAPGNGGIAGEAECQPVDAGDIAGLVALAERLAPDLTVVGPELPLVAGLCDEFRRRNRPVVGPNQHAAQLEGSKVFTKLFLERHAIPTAKLYGCFDSAAAAREALARVDLPVVIKADGLCAGKGVLVAQNREEAADFITRLMEKNELGEGGRRVILEQGLAGEELSFIILTDGQRYAPLVPTRDHKRVFDDNRGPNTGGMGAYSTDDLLSPPLRHTILSAIVEPTLRAFAADGIHYQGFLYFGLMLTAGGPKVLEFNCRLGDPETQAIVARMDFDLAEVLADAATGQLDPAKLRWKPGASVCVVLASGGYPGKSELGKRVEGLTTINDNIGVVIFHAATRKVGTEIVTAGGRVLGVTASAADLDAALLSVYRAIGKLRFEGMHYRKDIGASTDRQGAAGN